MKKVIRGKVLNTETAKIIGRFEAAFPDNDEQFYAETLFCSKSGEYFLYAQGNSGSKYHEIRDSLAEPKEAILSLQHEDARAWAFEHLERSEYNAHFEINSTKNMIKKVPLNVLVSGASMNKLRLIRSKTNMKTYAQIVDKCILDFDIDKYLEDEQ